MLRPLLFSLYLHCSVHCDYHNYRFGLFEDNIKTEAILKEELFVIAELMQVRKLMGIKGRYYDK